ncbi:MAG: pre-peptidase C-terminal domain-containing protein [Gammaproteobacteria bacterium]
MSKVKSRLMLAALTAVSGLVQAGTPEREANHPIASAQVLEITASGGSTTGGADLDAVIGNLTGSAAVDLDYFVFEGQAGDVVTLDIDGGMGGVRNVDTIMAIFGPAPAYTVLRMVDDISPIDPGSTSIKDARIQNFLLPATGTYVVGVSSYPRRFVNGGGANSTTLGTNANGDYQLLITGVTVPVMQVNIDIKPGSGDVAPINPKSKGKVPVALLGSADFAVDDVDTASLTFGSTGNEASLFKCGSPSDVNGDPYPDMVCHFENQAAAWVGTEDEAMLKGKLDSGMRFEGRGWLKVVPVKAED